MLPETLTSTLNLKLKNQEDGEVQIKSCDYF